MNEIENKNSSTEVINVADVLRKNHDVLRNTLSNDTEVHLHINDEVIPLTISEDIIKDVLINIAYHARRTINNGGYLVIVASNEEISSPDNDYHLPTGRYCQLICTEFHNFPTKTFTHELDFPNESLMCSLSNLLANNDSRVRFTQLDGCNSVITILLR